MTREGQDRGPGEDLQRPPASTQWSGPDATAGDELLPPFVPARSRAQPAPWSDAAQAPRATPATPKPATDWPVTDPGFDEPTFDAYAMDRDEALADDGQVVTEGADGGVGADDAGSAVSDPDEEPFPFEVPEHWDDTSAEEPHAFSGMGQDRAGADEPRVDEASADVAERLENLAARIRTNGREAARSEMASDDRLTALFATMIAGYLEGRET